MGPRSFAEPRVQRVLGFTSWYSAPPPDDQGRRAGGARERERPPKCTFRTVSVADGYSSTGVGAKFRLRKRQHDQAVLHLALGPQPGAERWSAPTT